MKSSFIKSACLWSVIIVCILCPTVIHAQSWETLADIPEKLTFPVAVTVAGKIHVMGGGATGGATMNHYQYDPNTNSWTKKANVPYRAQQPAGAANGNKIHFFGGGYPTSGAPLKNHYIYDANTDSWNQAADLTMARAIHYGVNLNGQVYTLAGQGVSDWCEVYDETSNSWIMKNRLPDTKFWYGAHDTTHGSIFRFCGGGYTAPVNFAHRYDPLTDSWDPLPNAPIAIHGLEGAAVKDKIYLVGGYHDFEDSKEVWIYDINSKTYSQGIPLPVGRTYHNIVELDNCIYSIGGNNAVDATVGVSLLRFCPEIIISNEQTQPVKKPRIENFPNQSVIHFDDPNVSWKLQLIDLTGKLVFSDAINPAFQNPYSLQTIGLPISHYNIHLFNQQTHYNYPYPISK